MFDSHKTLLRRPIVAGLGLALLVLVVMVGIAWSAATPLRPSKSVDDTRQALAAIDDLRFKIDRAESRQWAYFLTRDRIFLAERDAALTAVSLALRALDGLTIDNSEQQLLLKKLVAAVSYRVGLLSNSQASLDDQSTSDVAALTRDGRAAGEAVRAIMQQVEYREKELLVAREARERSKLQIVFAVIAIMLTFIVVQALRLRRSNLARLADQQIRQQVREVVLKAGALQAAIFNSANFSSIATDAQGVIQIFNVGAERMLGYKADDVVDKRTPADISDAQEVVARASTLSRELNTPIKPGFDALVFKASRGIEDIYELTYIRKDGSRFPAVVSVTALRDQHSAIIGYLLIGTDNTARKAAEQALLRAGALQSAIFNSANFSSIATDAQGVIQIFNVGAERMLGYRADEVVDQRTPADISDPQEVVARATTLSRELNTQIKPGFEALVFKASRGIEDIYELTYIRKDSSRFPAIVSVTALRDQQGTIIGYLLIGTDNTARKRVEAEQAILDLRLRDQQYYTRSLIESNLDALMTTDPKGIITDVNKQMEALTGCTRDELIGAPFKNYFTDPQRAEAGINLVLENKKVIDYELIVRSVDGNETMVSYNASTFYNRDRQLQGVFAAARDITTQKQASQYARSLIEASLDPLVTISPDGKVMDVNEATVKVTGVVREELLGSDFSSYFTEPAQARDGYQQVFAKGFVADYPLTIRQRGGKLTDVLYNASVYKDVEGNVLGVFAAARDITERKEFEHTLQRNNAELERATAAAEKANRAKSEFLSSMSHELRTPLNAILGFAQIIDSGMPQPTPGQKRNIDQILKAGWYLLELINEVLDLALIESGKLTLSLEPVSLSEVMLECCTMIEPQARSRGIDMTFPRFDAPLFVMADRTRVKQVLINLLFNAVKYNRAGGSIWVECTARSETMIHILVRDTGLGLSAGQLTELFQPFNRLGKESSNVEGTGIGLVVAKRLVELMGGSIGVQSTLDTGSEFWIELKLAPAPQLVNATEQAETSLVPPLTRGQLRHTLLYVEDNPANLELVEQLIERHNNLRLLSAADADIGIEFARIHQPDVILMDINLPGMNGVEAMKILRADAATAHIPIIALSANAGPGDIERGLQAGFFDYITKPIKVTPFMDSINNALAAAQQSKDDK